MDKQDDDTIRLGPWPKGMNNRSSKHDLPADTARDAFNVDFTDSGKVRRRTGFTQRIAGTLAHSVFGYSTHFLYVDGNTLYRGLTSPVALRTDMASSARVSYEGLNNEVFYSNGLVTGRVRIDGLHGPWGIDAPTANPTLTAAAGAMYGGVYNLTTVFVGPDGEESGAPQVSSITLSDNGSILLTNIQQPAGPFASYPDRIRFYCSKQNDDGLYSALTVPVGTTSATLNTMARARYLRTALFNDFPPCLHIAHYNGHIFGVDAKDPRVLWHTQALRYGLVDFDTDFLLFPSPIAVVGRVEDGIYVCSDKTYFLQGPHPGEFKQIAVLPFGAVPYSKTTITIDYRLAWFSPYGYVYAGDGGKVEVVGERNIAAPNYLDGAVLYREYQGLRQIVGSFRGGSQSGFVASDFADAEVIRSA